MQQQQFEQLLDQYQQLEQLEQAQLQRLVEVTSLHFFQRPFQHQATFNTRLRTTGGRYSLRTHNLDFNPKIWTIYGLDELLGVIKHELCHYHLHLAGEGYQHRDRAFKQLLVATGGTRFVKPLETANRQKDRVYVCTNCSVTIRRRRKIDTNKYVCGKCGGKLKSQQE